MPDTPSSIKSELEKLKHQLRVRDAADRVLNRALAMHHTSELQDVINEVGTQLKSLELDITGGVFISINEEIGPDLFVWGYGGTADYVQRVRVPYFDRPIFTGLLNHVKSGSGLYTEFFSREEKIEFFRLLFNHPPYNQTSPAHQSEVLSREGGYARSCYTSEHTSVFIINHHGRKFSEADNQVLIRFAEVFEQGYRRFLDLQKAEAQAREAQIEVALERTRTQSMLMQHSEELDATARVFHKQLLSLGIESEFSYVWLPDIEHEKHMFWATFEAPGEQGPFLKSKSVVYDLDRNEPYTAACFAAWESDEPVHVIPIPPEEVAPFFDTWSELLKGAEKLKAENFPDGLYYAEAYMKYGCFGINIRRKLTKSEEQILQRFTVEFERTYTRFLDLQKAEAQAREAKVEAALERVRARTMAMQKSSELSETAAAMFNQIELLGLRPWSCGFNIWDHERNKIRQWVSSGDGRILPSFETPSDEDVFLHISQAAKKGESLYIEEIGGEALVAHYHFMTSLPGIDEVVRELDEAGIELPKFQVNHSAFFSHGYLMFITYEPAPEFHDIFRRFATVFDQTYTRFLDLKQAEEQELLIRQERDRLEKTLNELRETQAQLIHSEKMASLGELTAGIAHEIQNPLNFVNNFSEVSSELLGELKEELENGSREEAIDLLEDLLQNLQKINHHGHRASGIVKSMLDHSRARSGEAMETDINALCDEYLRLAYHGTRAKDPDFSAAIETEYAENLPKLKVVPQDMGRVFLNLINNAFQAISEKSKDAGPGNLPLVRVSTKALQDAGGVQITISDNGPGIPDKIRQKIFQPFFTTKPTGQGTGLGLSLSYDIVQAHGGTLALSPDKREGTAFIIELPNASEDGK